MYAGGFLLSGRRVPVNRYIDSVGKRLMVVRRKEA